MSQAERRGTGRIIRPLLIRYRPQGRVDLNWHMSPLRDLSQSGARFVSEQAFSLGTALEVQLTLPIRRESIRAGAKIIRTHALSPQLFEYGIAFGPLASDVQHSIDVTVDHFMKKAGRPHAG